MTQAAFFSTMKPDAEYDWMHPSWRDLVIEHLQVSRADRQRFLGRCGPQGILLALSSAGGGKGTRETPLLVDDEDWKIIQTTILKLLESSQSAIEARMVLGAINGAMLRKCGAKWPQCLPVSDPLHGLAMMALQTLRNKWDAANCLISVATLSEYFNISRLLSPLPPMPNLRHTWEELWGSVVRLSGKDSMPLDSLSEAISKWLDLVEIVEASEPRLLQQMAYPESHLDAVRNYLDGVQEDANSDLDSESPDEYDSGISRMEDLETVVEQIGSLFPLLEDRAQVVHDEVASAHSNLRDARHEKFPEPPDDYEGRAPASRPSGGFDVDELFADL